MRQHPMRQLTEMGRCEGDETRARYRRRLPTVHVGVGGGRRCRGMTAICRRRTTGTRHKAVVADRDANVAVGG